MGLFDSLFGAPAAKPKTVSVNEIIPIIQSAGSPAALRTHIAAYGKMDNPTVQYMLAVQCLMLGMTAEAKRFYLLGAKHGCRAGGEYYNNSNADSIGQCLTHLVTQFPLSGASAAIEKATLLAYIHLSKCVNLFGDRAYDSLRSRAILLLDHESPMALMSFMMQAFEGQLKEVLVIADLVHSSPGFAKVNPNIARESMAKAKSLHFSLDDMTVAGKDADEYSLEELAQVGAMRHKMAFSKLEPSFLAGRLALSDAELHSILA